NRILSSDILHAWHQADEAKDAEMPVERRILDGGAVNHQAHGGVFGLDHRSAARHVYRLYIRAYIEPDVDLEKPVDRESNLVLLGNLEASFLDYHAVVSRRQFRHPVGPALG